MKQLPERGRRGDAFPAVKTSLRHSCEFPVWDYDLAATLSCGQAFRWFPRGESDPTSWTGVVQGRWVRLRQSQSPGTGARRIHAEVSEPVSEWRWLSDYLQLEAAFESLLATFPNDATLHEAVAACRGLRLLRQEPWECLASFICSSTKQIVQIRQIVARLSELFGEPLVVPPGETPVFAFPTVGAIAAAAEVDLRRCLLGFRAPYLKATAQAIVAGKIDLAVLGSLTLKEARAALMALPGVGRKIADCVLLFAYGFPTAFPIDVWVLRALRELYFPGRRVTMKRLRRFSETHFGPNGGYAQQYLFHYMRNFRPSSNRGSSQTMGTNRNPTFRPPAS
jgi:N-glycosylase/DNA lyase